MGRWEGVRGDARSRHRDLVMSDFVMSDSRKPVCARRLPADVTPLINIVPGAVGFAVMVSF